MVSLVMGEMMSSKYEVGLDELASWETHYVDRMVRVRNIRITNMGARAMTKSCFSCDAAKFVLLVPHENGQPPKQVALGG